ncbi:hypothetical protein UFOVP1305_22 [uncultured Caudovirales phage]|uniref:Uncharacterized protein n=1 Tax=uncultured Caudovirales phage TaxID=2100421 RepID=A0A6J5RTT9_9CAUD|nr:hypothetical protein UFOVP896_60 [uncultured Caudovirales phage]CAB4197586.1 hypothetical protein UFOVP1305_22 [uncultured Caudovirales phage]
MSTIAEDFVFERKGRGTKYPWAEWSDGQVRILTEGVDFDSKVSSLSNSVYVYAKRHGMRAQVQRVSATQIALTLKPIAST